jgi:hypothetical protein
MKKFTEAQNKMGHFKNLRDVYKREGFSQALLYDFDQSILRKFIPYNSELLPVKLGLDNYRVLMKETNFSEQKGLNALLSFINAGTSISSECARGLITSATYYETSSPPKTLLAWAICSAFFSFRNHLEGRFYKSAKQRDTQNGKS